MKPLLMFILLLLSASASWGQQMVKSYARLKSSLESNHPPSGYINLSECTVLERVGGTPHEYWSYSITFDHRFDINNRTGQIVTAFSDDVLHENESGQPVLTKFFTAFSALPENDTTDYTVSITDTSGKLLMRRRYRCPWSTAVHLWRK